MDNNALTTEDKKLIKKKLMRCKHNGLIEVLLRGKYPISVDAALVEMKKAHPKFCTVDLVKIIQAVNNHLKKIDVIMRRDVVAGIIWFDRQETQLLFEFELD